MKTIIEEWKYLLVATAAALLLALVPAAGADAAELPAQGIDVSEYQGDIDWQAVANSGVTFAMVRVGNTAYGLDECYYENIIEADAVGIRVGVYCYTYATTVEAAAADAQLVVNAIAGLPVSFPVAIDIEDPVQQSLSMAEQQAIVNTFCSIVYAAGYTPMVYANTTWFQTRLGQTAWDQWVAEWGDSMNFTGTMWQFTSSGTVSGISGNVDRDYVLKDYFTLIPANGLSEQGGVTYYYVSYRKQFGMQTIGDVTYYFDGTGAMIKDMTITDDAGNIIRMCQDGHVVIITAEMQAAAAAALLQAQTQAALLTQYQEEQAAYEAAAADALNQYTAAQALADEYLATLETAQYNAAVLPTEENLNILALAQAQYDQYTANAATALSSYETLQAAAVEAAALTQTQEAVAAQAQADSDAAQLTVVIPD